MLVKTFGSAVYGVEAVTITVEVNVLGGKNYYIVGLPDNAVKESWEQKKSALRNCGFEFPEAPGVTIHLALPRRTQGRLRIRFRMALGLAGCMGQFFGKPLDKCMFLGDLSLVGKEYVTAKRPRKSTRNGL